ncbi:structural maintenance of chromosomes protein 1A-like [Daphnia carinata]|uniref:structural maintenance of chromosomes protein 1A-like n=1 Tax=Daphnia carinata TaxID=120202 RepID=UPI00257E68D1|nr:structural maintenance of chromosomes protein 1A-like [Daphnia carinata]
MAKVRSNLKYIEVENFKSYQGFQRIGPLKNFSAVIGPNGSGKSNFMDAVSFVMGEKTQTLRVKRLSDLIHGASINKPVSRSAMVAAIFELEDGTELKFTRIVQGSSSEHRFNGEMVNPQRYFTELEKLGINVKAKNFLVFQGAVENIAMKNPKERTALFEEISGSGALKEDYDRLKAEMLKAEEDTQFTLQKKKGIAAERKEARMEKEEAEKYQKLREDLAEQQIVLYLFKLYHCEQDIKTCREDIAKKQQELGKIERRKEKADEILKEKKKEHTRIGRELAKMEQDIREIESEINKKRPTFIKAKERVTHMQKKLEAAQKSLTQARKANDAHAEDIEQLEKELSEVDKRREEYEAELQSESQSQGRSVHLEEEQVAQYHRLKEEAGRQSARYLQELDSVNREQKSDQDRLDNESRVRGEIENQLRQRQHELEETQKRSDKLMEHIRTTETALEEQMKLQGDLTNEVEQSKNQIDTLQSKLDGISKNLGEAKVDKHEDARRRKKQEIVENFKRLYRGVYDRIINMCHPVHQRFNIPVTKLLGKYMEAIVVDTEETARNCIQYLKEQMLEPETFLPLNYLKAKPLKERLRVIRDPPNVRLLYDVLQYDPPEIKKAVLFVTNNALVCDTQEDAMKVAYDLGDGDRYDAVALDGTFYQKSGLISGGSRDLEKKAARWNDKQLSALKSNKEKLSEELREAMKKSRKESELHTVNCTVKGLDSRLRYALSDREKTAKQIEQSQGEIAKLEVQLRNFAPATDEIEKIMRERDLLIQNVKERMNRVEDTVFAEFCSQIGVANIRQYEERELRTQQERAKKRLEFENQKNRILNQLEFERSRDTQTNVERWERSVSDDEEELERAKQAEQKQMSEIDKEMRKLDDIKSTRMSKKNDLDNMEEDMALARRDMGTVAKDLQNVQKSITSMEAKIDQKRSERHGILKQSKMEDIIIPMSRGNMEDIEQDGNITESMNSESVTTAGNDSLSTVANSQTIYEREERIVIDYSDLPDKYKDLFESDEVRREGDRLQRHVNELNNTIQRIQAPNMRAMQKLDLAREKLHETNEEFEKARVKTKKAKQAFERVKKERFDLFMSCFEHVSNEIDGIYKSLAKNQSAQAFLGPENPEEPYLDGINYNCVAPGKRFQPMSNLSGGEKTVAALALLFAIHSYQPAPFFVLDEIDAALDNTNISKVAGFIRTQTANLQTIVISLKEEFYSHADALIGVCPDPGECLISKMLLLDLTQYPPHQFEETQRL